MRRVVLATEVWLDLLRVPEGPPAVLAARLQQGALKALRSSMLLDELEAALEQLGWEADARQKARRRVEELSEADEGPGVGDWATALARRHQLGEVFVVGPRAGTSVDGVAWRPVHELWAPRT